MKPEWFGPIVMHAKAWTPEYLGDVLLRAALGSLVIFAIIIEIELVGHLLRGEYPRFDYAPYEKGDDCTGVVTFCAIGIVASIALWRLS